VVSIFYPLRQEYHGFATFARTLFGAARCDATSLGLFGGAAPRNDTVRDPDLPRRLASGELRESDGDQCNRCVAAMDGAGVEFVSARLGLLPRNGTDHEKSVVNTDISW
jgi:hypothetical protein